VLYTLGVQFRLFWLCVIGRLIYAIADNSYPTSLSMASRWFKDRQLALAIGILNATVRLGSSLGFLLLPILVYFNVVFAFWAGCLIYLICFTFSVFLNGLDWYGEPRLKNGVNNDKSEIQKEEENASAVSLQDIKNLPVIFWFIGCFNACYYMSFAMIFATGVDALNRTGKYYDAATASQLLSIPLFVSIVAYPITGIIIDKFNFNIPGAFVGICLWILALFSFLGHIYGIFIPIELTMVFLGIGYTVYANGIYSYYPLIADGKILTTAVAISGVLCSILQAIMFPVLGAIQSLPTILNTLMQDVIPVIL